MLVKVRVEQYLKGGTPRVSPGFTSFHNILPTVVKMCRVNFYADDIILYCYSRDTQVVKQ